MRGIGGVDSGPAVCGRVRQSGSECVLPVSSEASAMSSRPVRIEADDGGGLAGSELDGEAAPANVTLRG